MEEINKDFNTGYKETDDFYRASLLRNSSKPGYLEDAIASANQTFRSVLPLWHLINQHLPDLQAKTAQYQAESLQGLKDLCYLVATFLGLLLKLLCLIFHRK